MSKNLQDCVSGEEYLTSQKSPVLDRKYLYPGISKCCPLNVCVCVYVCVLIYQELSSPGEWHASLPYLHQVSICWLVRPSVPTLPQIAAMHP